MAQPTDGITRVVLETKQDSQYSVSLNSNPYRLTIEVHKPVGAKTTPTLKTPPVTLPKPSPAIIVARNQRKRRKSPSSVSPSRASPPPTFRLCSTPVTAAGTSAPSARKVCWKKTWCSTSCSASAKSSDQAGSAGHLHPPGRFLSPAGEARRNCQRCKSRHVSLRARQLQRPGKRARVETYYTTTYSSIKARTEDDSTSLTDVNWTGVDIREKVTDSHRLAADIQQALYGGLAVRNPDLRNRGVKEAQHVVLTGTQMPAVLAEVSFVSSPADETQLENSAHRQLIAEALYKGVARYRKEITATK